MPAESAVLLDVALVLEGTLVAEWLSWRPAWHRLVAAGEPTGTGTRCHLQLMSVLVLVQVREHQRHSCPVVILVAVPDVLEEHLKFVPLGILIQVEVYAPLPRDDCHADVVPRISWAMRLPTVYRGSQ